MINDIACRITIPYEIRSSCRLWPGDAAPSHAAPNIRSAVAALRNHRTWSGELWQNSGYDATLQELHRRRLGLVQVLMGLGQAPRRIEADRFSPDFMAVIDSLFPGEEILITRDGNAVAKMSATREKLQSKNIDGSLGSDYDKVSVVATAMKLSESARTALSEQLGHGYIVVDMYSAPKSSVDVLLVPPLSPQLIGSLREGFPQARVVIAEIEDEELGISYEGPVRRLLDAGADTYLPPSDIPRLAQQLDNTMTYFTQLEGKTSAPLTIESAVDDEP